MAIYEKIAIFAFYKIRQQYNLKMTVSGTITAISPLQSGTSKAGKEWRKIDVVLTYDNTKAEYPKSVLFSVMNENIEKFALSVGNEYDVEVDFSVREYNGKNYMSANAWKATAKNTPIATTQQSAPTQTQAQAQQSEQPKQEDDLPF